MDAVEWAAKRGANVLNLTLGGPTYSQTAANVYAQIRNQNRLIVAASGNDGTSSFSYPASYDDVIGVGAVDEGLERACEYN